MASQDTALLQISFEARVAALSRLPADRKISWAELIDPLRLPEGAQLIGAVLGEDTVEQWRQFAKPLLESSQLTLEQWQAVLLALAVFKRPAADRELPASR